MNTTNSKSTKNIIYIGLLLVCFMVLSWRAQYGVDWNDEGFYLALVHRFYLGDIPFLNEWNMAQAFAVFILPIYKLYMLLMGNNEGVYLFIRIVYLIANLLISLYLYYIFSKKSNQEIAGIAAFFFLIFARDGIPSLSYYAMSLQTLILSLLLFIDVDDKQRISSNIKLVFSGALFAIFVASNPYSVFVYFLFIITVIWKKHNKKECLQTIYNFVLGTIVVTAIFLSFILRKASLSQLINSLTYILNNPDHPSGISISKVVKWLWYSVKPFGMYTTQELNTAVWYQFVGVFLVVVIIIYSVLFKILKKDIPIQVRKAIFPIMLILCAFYIINTRALIGGSYIALSFLGLQAYLMDNDSKNEIFCYFFLPGLGLSLAYQMASDTGINSMTIGYAISAIASLLIIYDYYAKNRQEFNKTIRISFILLLGITLVLTFYLRVFNVYKDQPLAELVCKIQEGPHKGLYTNKSSYDEYTQIVEVLKHIDNNLDEDDFVMISAMLPWGYTWLDNRVGAPTVWGNYLGSARLEQYFGIHPERIPDCIFIIDKGYGRNNRDNVPSVYMSTLLQNKLYHIEKFPCGTLYLK